MLLFSIAAFGSVSPHFIFGSRLYSQGVSVKSPENQAWSSGDFSVLPANPAFIESVESLCLTDEAFRNLSASDPSEFEILLNKLCCNLIYCQLAMKTWIKIPTTK